MGGEDSTRARDYRKHVLLVIVGFLAMTFPFIPPVLIIVLIFLLFVVMLFLSEGNRLFDIISSPLERRAGVLVGPLRLCIAILFLAMCSAFLGFPLHLFAATVGIVTIGTGATVLVSLRHGGMSLLTKCLFLIGIGTAASFLLGMWVLENLPDDVWTMLAAGLIGVPQEGLLTNTFLLAVVGTLCGTLLYSILDEDPLAIPIGSGMSMWLFWIITYGGTVLAVDPLSVAVAVAFPLAVGVASFRFGAADTTGVLSGALIGLLIIIYGGISWFVLFLCFFVLGSVFTKFKYALKRRKGIEQPHHGSRGYLNAFGNGLVPLVFGVLYGITALAGEPEILFAAGFLGAIATATGDTMASEIGGTSRARPVLITTLKQVPTGTGGGVTILGEFAAIAGAAIIGVVALVFGILEPSGGFGSLGVALVAVVAIAGFIGTNADSLFGATLEKWGILTNDTTNLTATLVGALCAVAIASFF